MSEAAWEAAEYADRKRRKTNGSGGEDVAVDYSSLTLSLDQWFALDVPPRRLLLGDILSTTTRAMLSADTGLGKTHIGFGIAFAIAAGDSFCNWEAHEPARVLIVDGEMSRELLKERLADGERRLGRRPHNLFVACKEDAEQMPPLDTPDGQQWLDGLMAHLGGIDFLIADNVMSLTIGDMLDPIAWQPVAAWMRTLTKRKVGCLWIHHTGHDASRAYGTKTREWQLDLVMVAEKVNDVEADIAVKLTFPKARQRKPSTSADYKPVTLRLIGDTWESTSAERNGRRSMPKDAHVAMDTLREAISQAGEPVSCVGPVPPGTQGVKNDIWRHYFYRRHPIDLDTPDNRKDRRKAEDARRQRFKRSRDALQEAGWITCLQEWVWVRK